MVPSLLDLCTGNDAADVVPGDVTETDSVTAAVTAKAEVGELEELEELALFAGAYSK